MSGEPEDAYQAMLRQRADDDAVMFAGQASANGSLGFAPVGAELAGGLLAARTAGGAMPMGPGEQQRYDTMLQMNGWWAPSGGPRPSLLDTRGPLLQVHSSSEVARLQSGVTLAQPMPAPAPAPPPHPAPHPTRQANTPAPASFLNTPGSWDHMISYTQRNATAEALAEALYATLRERYVCTQAGRGAVVSVACVRSFLTDCLDLQWAYGVARYQDGAAKRGCHERGSAELQVYSSDHLWG